jgi:hypothetical protein
MMHPWSNWRFMHEKYVRRVSQKLASTNFMADLLQCERTRWWMLVRVSRSVPAYFFRSPFFTPASGKTHIAATMSTAVPMTKVASSGRTGEPLQ